MTSSAYDLKGNFSKKCLTNGTGHENVSEKRNGLELYHLQHQGPVARSLVSANRWLRGIKMYGFPWYLTLVSTNHASSNPGQMKSGPGLKQIIFSLKRKPGTG